MTTTLEQANAALKAAVHERLGNTPADDPKMVGYSPLTEPRQVVASTEETQNDESDVPYIEHLLQRQRGDSLLSETYAEWEPGFQPVTPAEQTLRDAIAAVRDRHTKYGPPVEHFGRTASLVNAAFGTTFTSADWALVMVLDKVARLRGPTPTTDGGVDIAGYGGCYEECRSTLP